MLQQGFSRLYRNGEIIELQKPEDYTYSDFTNTFVLIDRLKADPEIRQRLVDSLEICFREGHGAEIRVPSSEFRVQSSSNPEPATLNTEQALKFSDRYICKYDSTRYEEPEPTLFSFNSPQGMCPTCNGLGSTRETERGTQDGTKAKRRERRDAEIAEKREEGEETNSACFLCVLCVLCGF